MGFSDALCDKMAEWEYKIYLTFEKKKHLLIKLEYVCYDGYQNEE